MVLAGVLNLLHSSSATVVFYKYEPYSVTIIRSRALRLDINWHSIVLSCHAPVSISTPLCVISLTDSITWAIDLA